MLGMFWSFNHLFVVWFQNCVFWASPRKAMQNHLEISSKLSFGPEVCEIGPKVGTWTCPSCPKGSKWGRQPPKNTPLFQKQNRISFCYQKNLRFSVEGTILLVGLSLMFLCIHLSFCCIFFKFFELLHAKPFRII